MPEVAVEDIRQMYQHSVILLKNKPVYVENVDRDGSVQVFDLLSQRSSFVPFSLRDFNPLTRRLGFINTKGSVVYAYRLPVRKYKVGVCSENTKVVTLDVNYPYEKLRTRDRIKEFNAPEIGDALFDRYPTFKEALAFVAKRDGAMAFDKQFAVASGGLIYYKTSNVGAIHAGKDKIEDIRWFEGKEHLIELIGDNYAKNLRNPKQV